MKARKDREYDPVCTSMEKQHKNVYQHETRLDVNQHETRLVKMLEKNRAPTQQQWVAEIWQKALRPARLFFTIFMWRFWAIGPTDLKLTQEEIVLSL